MVCGRHLQDPDSRCLLLLFTEMDGCTGHVLSSCFIFRDSSTFVGTGIMFSQLALSCCSL